MRKYGIAYIFILPAMILIAFFMVIPLIRSFAMSLFKWDGILEPKFIGLKNYNELFKDPYFWNAFVNNFIFMILAVFFTVTIGFLFAVAIERRVFGWSVYKYVYYIPVMLSMTVVGSLFFKILEPNFGLLNTFLRTLGLETSNLLWLGDPKTALYSIIGVTIWQYCGFTMILFLVAVEGIPFDIHDAATIDGVNGMQRLLYITMPYIKRVFMVVIMLQIIFSFKVFDIVWVMTEGGPGSASEVLGTLLYKTAFTSQKFGYASAIAVIMTVVVFIISLVYIRFSRLDKHEIE